LLCWAVEGHYNARMGRSPHVTVRVDLRLIRENVERIALQTRVPIIAVVKADAYGLGADRVVPAIADLVESFCVFSLSEARALDLWRLTSRPSLAIGPPTLADPQEYLAAHARPAVSTAAQARELKEAHPILCVDTGQQRFACPAAEAASIISEGGCDEAFTHATNLAQVRAFRQAVGGIVSRMHAAGSSLLGESEALLHAVRPGLALYRGAVRVAASLVEVRKSTGPAGYSGFESPYHGVILAGYSHGLRPGPCLVNGRAARVLEVGMQSAFVQTDATDCAGDEVVLLGDRLTERQVADAWGTTPQEALVRLTGAGSRQYVE